MAVSIFGRSMTDLSFRMARCFLAPSRALHASAIVQRGSLDSSVTTDLQPSPELITRPQLPLVTSRNLAFPPKFRAPRQVWVSNLDTVEEEKLGLMDLHPDVFAEKPRMDLIARNVRWQQLYRFVNYANTKTRNEVRGGGRKPWPQKGGGRARHGSIRSPIWVGGGRAHGPRGPQSYFYMLSFDVRLNGLRGILSAKLAQDDLHVVDSLDLPSDDPKYLEKLVEERGWGPAVLFVDDTDYMPLKITAATDAYGHYNLMPVYGLNVYSMLKHQTLVLTMAAVERIEERILFHLHRNDASECGKKFRFGRR